MPAGFQRRAVRSKKTVHVSLAVKEKQSWPFGTSSRHKLCKMTLRGSSSICFDSAIILCDVFSTFGFLNFTTKIHFDSGETCESNAGQKRAKRKRCTVNISFDPVFLSFKAAICKTILTIRGASLRSASFSQRIIATMRLRWFALTAAKFVAIFDNSQPEND